uniref:Uncharacterized protein n=2 Tax=Lutzomyia longipalpis TaxID=7200 RepID=A0A1B0GL45_LUTLO
MDSEREREMVEGLLFDYEGHESASSGDEAVDGEDGAPAVEPVEATRPPTGLKYPENPQPAAHSGKMDEYQFPLKLFYILPVLVFLHIVLQSDGLPPKPPDAISAAGDAFEIPQSCKDELQELKDEYPNQDATFWPALEYNLWSVLKDPPRPSIVTFLYNVSTSTTLLDKIVYTTHACMHPEMDPIVVNGMTFSESRTGGDFGVIIDKYKEALRRSRVMFVENLQDIPGLASRAFHDLCDSYNPIIDRYVVYFSLFYTRADWDESPNPNALASDLLKRRWDDEITVDTAAALIARVTEAVLVLREKIY